MKITHTIVALLMVLIIGIPSLLLAQASGGNTPSTGLFGPRVMSKPLQPQSSTLVRGLVNQNGGAFLGTGRPVGGDLIAAPWRLPLVQPNVVSLGFEYNTPIVQETVNLQVPQNLPADQFLIGQPMTIIQNAQNAAAEAAGEQTATAGENGQAAAPVVRGAPKFVTAEGAAAEAARAANFRVSTALSNRMTLLARNHGINTPNGITVSLGDGTAILRGQVGNSNDRAIIAHMVGLEPGVWRVDNQLTLTGQ
jgi:hypothetical protein